PCESVAAGPARLTAEGGVHLASGRLRLGPEECFCLHDHARDAVAALGCLLVDEGPLQRVRVGYRAQSLERGDGPTGNRADPGLTGPDCPAVQLDCARATLSKSAAEAEALEAYFVAEHVEEWCVRISLNSVVLAVHLDGEAAARKQPGALSQVGAAA